MKLSNIINIKYRGTEKVVVRSVVYLARYSQTFFSSTFLRWMQFFFQAVWGLKGKQLLPLTKGFIFIWRLVYNVNYLIYLVWKAQWHRQHQTWHRCKLPTDSSFCCRKHWLLTATCKSSLSPSVLFDLVAVRLTILVFLFIMY